MKRILTLTALALGLSCSGLLLADALKEGYVSMAATDATNSAKVIFPAAPTKTIRLVYWDVKGDTNVAAVYAMGGTTTTALTATNTLTGATATNLIVASTTGFNPSDYVVIQRGDDVVWQGVVHATNNMTNLTVTAPLTVLFPVASTIYKMGDIRGPTLIGSNTVRQAGEALMHTQRRKPLMLRVDGSGSPSVLINNAVVHYDDN